MNSILANRKKKSQGRDANKVNICFYRSHHNLLLIVQLLVFLFVFSSCGDLLPSAQQIVPQIVKPSLEQVEKRKVLPNSYLVAFRSSRPTSNRFGFINFSEEARHHQSALDRSFGSESKIKNFYFLTSVDLKNPSFYEGEGEKKKALFGLDKIFKFDSADENDDSSMASIARVDFTDTSSADAALKEWADDGRIFWAEPNYQSQISEENSDEKSKAKLTEEYWTGQITAYKDVSFSWFTLINLNDAFESLASISGSADDRPLIAIMDSGIDVKHEALSGQVWENDSPGGASCGDDDVYDCTRPIKFSK